MSCELECFMSGQQFKKLSDKKYEPLMCKYNLRKIELDILYFLSIYLHYDTAKDIVAFKSLSKAHVSKAIDNLCQQNLIDTTMDCDDRRCNHLAVTEKAKPIIDEINQIRNEIFQVIYHGLSEEEKVLFIEIAGKIACNISAELENE